MSKYAEQNPDVVVYDAPDPHECIAEGSFTPDMHVGSIIRCDCGRHWHLSIDAWERPIWRPVRWWDFEARKRIREAKEAKT